MKEIWSEKFLHNSYWIKWWRHDILYSIRIIFNYSMLKLAKNNLLFVKYLAQHLLIKKQLLNSISCWYYKKQWNRFKILTVTVICLTCRKKFTHFIFHMTCLENKLHIAKILPSNAGEILFPLKPKCKKYPQISTPNNKPKYKNSQHLLCVWWLEIW